MSWMWSFVRPSAPAGAPAGLGSVEPDSLDAFVASYVSWREQCAEVQSAYERWISGREEGELAFAIYRAELEFEEDAARAHRAAAERLGRRIGA